MAVRLPEYFELAKHNVAPADIVGLYLRCEPDAVHENVIITPIWDVGFLDHFTEITTVSEGRVYEGKYGGQAFSVVRSGVGAPQTGDVALALACTPCRRVIFTGSAGGLSSSMRVGDLLLVDESVSGEGFSRYLPSDVETRDSFLSVARPDATLAGVLKSIASRTCESESIPLHTGRVFAIDTIVAQFFRLDHVADELDCMAIEMEASATFNVAELVGIQAAAILQVSDLPRAGKSLFAGRTSDDEERRRTIRSTVLPEIILDSLVTPSEG